MRYAVLTVVGAHAGEGVDAVLARKREEAARGGRAFWLVRSFKARLSEVQKMCREAALSGEGARCLFVAPGATGGARPTVTNVVAKEFSDDGTTWEPLPESAHVTGKIDAQCVALVLGDISESTDGASVDMWSYKERSSGATVRFTLGASTACCVKVDDPVSGMSSRYRRLVAVGTLVAPYAVRVR